MNLKTLNHNVETMLREHLAARMELTTADLQELLRLLAKWRHMLISSILIKRQGLVV